MDDFKVLPIAEAVRDLLSAEATEKLFLGAAAAAGAAALAAVGVWSYKQVKEANTKADFERMEAMTKNDIRHFESSSSAGAETESGGTRTNFNFGDGFKATR
ncbi:hypothetical protein [Paraburkholderia pallida]|uniref:Uncharacterized protein n=1 Tax=Paraburkholderia pallida TaxID=2547399 RepID=A0A4P7D6B3_9BURK|nr:hypothetical protein [Paraburkholderia pallida]QBR04351.1 hypothetical protein E1956_45460 [Paraburkholderia pallida]